MLIVLHLKMNLQHPKELYQARHRLPDTMNIILQMLHGNRDLTTFLKLGGGGTII